MTDLLLAHRLGDAMALAIEIRDSGHKQGVFLVDALNLCVEHVAHDDLAAAGIAYNSMNYLQLLAWLDARA